MIFAFSVLRTLMSNLICQLTFNNDAVLNSALGIDGIL